MRAVGRAEGAVAIDISTFRMEAWKAFTFSGSALNSSASASTWKGKFSGQITDPAAGSAQAFTTSSPSQSLQKNTGFPSFSSRILAAGASDNFLT